MVIFMKLNMSKFYEPKLKKTKAKKTTSKGSNLMKDAKDTIALGTVNTMGAYAFGRIGANHPATATTANAVVGGLNILQTGQLAKNAMGIANMIQTESKPRRKKK